jgi:hypothetical protein
LCAERRKDEADGRSKGKPGKAKDKGTQLG